MNESETGLAIIALILLGIIAWYFFIRNRIEEDIDTYERHESPFTSQNYETTWVFPDDIAREKSFIKNMNGTYDFIGESILDGYGVIQRIFGVPTVERKNINSPEDIRFASVPILAGRGIVICTAMKNGTKIKFSEFMGEGQLVERQYNQIKHQNSVIADLEKRHKEAIDLREKAIADYIRLDMMRKSIEPPVTEETEIES
jgi:hypothetical protein